MSIFITDAEIPTSGDLLVIIAPNGEVKYKKSVAPTWDRTSAVSVSPNGGLKVVKTLTQNMLDKIRATEGSMSMDKMTSSEICKLLEIIVGNTEPTADSTIDAEREENLKTLINIGDWVLDGLLYAADHRKDSCYSSQVIGERAYATMLEWKDWLATKEVELA